MKPLNRAEWILLVLLFVGVLTSTDAYQIFQGPPPNKFSETTVIVDKGGATIPQLHGAFGEHLVAELSPYWQQSFEYTVSNTQLNENTTTGTGSVTQATGMAVVSSGSTAGSNAILHSTHHAKYKPGIGGSLRFTAKFTSPGVANTWQLIGLMDEHGSSAEFVNGYALGFKGTTPTIARFQNDVLFEEPRSSWDDKLDGTGPSRVSIDFTKLNVFYIQYQYLGGGPIYFWVGDPATGIPFKFHTIKYNNRFTTPSVYNPNLHFTMYVDNQSAASNLTLSSASYGYFVEGKTELIEIHQPQFATGKRTKTNVTTETAVVTLRNKTQFAGKLNYIDIILERFATSIEANSANNLADCRLVKNATLGGAASWVDVSTTNSVVDIDTSSTTVTGGTTMLWQPLAGKNDKMVEQILPLKIIIHPGDTITAACASANTATLNSGILWKELQ